MGTIDTIRRAPSRGLVWRIAYSLVNAFGWLDFALERRRSRKALRELDDRLLKDIGISRADAYRESSRPFWD